MGKPKIIESPEKLWDYYTGYLETLGNQAAFKVKDWVGKDAKEVERVKAPPPTWAGLESYIFRNNLEATSKFEYVNLEDYRSNKEGRYTAFAGVVRAIDQDMREKKFGGAAVGVFQHNIIAREMGLGEKAVIEAYSRPILEGGKPLPKDDDDGLPSNDELLGL